jgi:hypothetical protein
MEALPTRRAKPAAVLVAALGGALACASLAGGPRFEFFAEPRPDAAWYPKVLEWQGRAQGERGDELLADRGRLAAQRSGLLDAKMAVYRDEERRELASRIQDWSRVQARKHYRWDPRDDPVYDHWPTVGELLATNGDDCDGLDLIAYQLLREFGFPEHEVYRAVIRRDHDGANHMVTFWFEDRRDPWVLDVTGAMSARMRRLSELPGWTPTILFNDTEQYDVVESPPRSPALARD